MASAASSSYFRPLSDEEEIDTLLSDAGYSVRSSDLPILAHRLHHLDSIATSSSSDSSSSSQFLLHCNPSDMAACIDSMLGHLPPTTSIPSPLHSSVKSGAAAFDPPHFLLFPSDGLLSSDILLLDDFRSHQSPTLDCAAAPASSSSIAPNRQSLETAPSPDSSAAAFLPDPHRLPPSPPQPAASDDGDGAAPPPPSASSSSSRCSYGSRSFDARCLQSPPASPSYGAGFLQPVAEDLVAKGRPNSTLCGAAADYTGDAPEQIAGIMLVHLLMACAEAVQSSEIETALGMAAEIAQLARMDGGAMGKVASYFANALMTRACAGAGSASAEWATTEDELSEALYLSFYEACPYLKFAHFTANQAILDAVEGYRAVHIIDFNLMQGLQWPALIHALASRSGGAPRLRITGVGLPQTDDKDALREVGMRLAELAAALNVNFSFRGVIATKLDDVKPRMLEVEEGEAVAVNAVMQLHRLLGGGGAAAAIEEVLESVRSLAPKVVTVVEQEANHNSAIFLDRFVQSLRYYCAMFDSLEASGLPRGCRELAFAAEHLGREIANIVACEGAQRVERHEPMAMWRRRMEAAGFRPLRLGEKAMAQASLLLTLFSGEGYTVAEAEEGVFLTLAWHSTPMISASAWRSCRG